MEPSYLSRGLNLSRSSNSLNSASELLVRKDKFLFPEKICAQCLTKYEIDGHLATLNNTNGIVFHHSHMFIILQTDFQYWFRYNREFNILL